MRKIISLLLALLILFSLLGCGNGNNADIEAQNAQILAERRDRAESYMRSMATVLWRATEDITYSNNSKCTDPTLPGTKDLIYIKAGRLYRGIPYSHAAGGPNAFLEYATEPDEKGIHSISNLTWHPLTGSNATARIGNDCASAVGLSWGLLGNSLLQDSNTKYMTTDYGYLRVGEYISNSDAHTYTLPVCEENGYDVMAAAYAKLQKADGVVRRNKADNNGHAMMVVSVHTEYTEDGSISGATSYITVLEQTSGYIEQQKFKYDAELGENVYTTYLIDNKYTFFDLFTLGYLPITCKELIDPSPVVEIGVTDSLTDHSIDNLMEGTLTSTRFIESVAIQIFDTSDNVLQQCSASPINRQLYTFDMQVFETDRPEVFRGNLDFEALASGAYRCKVLCRLITGDEFVVRDFEFTN